MSLPSDVKYIEILPNWSSPYTVAYEFKTDILTSRSGLEQRRAARMSPRKSIGYTSNPDGDTLRALKTTIAYNQGLRFAIPEITDFVNITSNVPNFGDTFTVDDVPGWLVAGAFVGLRIGNRSRQAEVVSITGNTVHVLVGLDTGGTDGRLYPLRLGRLSTTLTSRRQTDRVAEYPIDFDVDPATEIYSDPGLDYSLAGSTLSHLGTEVFTLRPNWATPIEIGNEVKVDRLDFDFGRIKTFMPYQFPVKTMKASYVGRTREETDDVRRFFFRAKGQRGAFFQPSWESDLLLAADFAAGDSSIKVKSTDVATLNGIPGFGHLCFVMRTGAIVPAQIDNMVPVPLESATQIIFVRPLPAGVTAADIDMICWLSRVRFASDTLTIAWQSNTVATFDLTTRSLDNDAFDDPDQLFIAGFPVAIASNPVEIA